MEENLEIAKQLVIGLLDRIGVNIELEGFLKEGEIHINIKGDREGILIGKHGRTLDSLQFLINRMVNKRLKEPVRVVLDINDYRKRREESLKRMAVRLGEKAKIRGHGLTIGPFNAHDRRIIHLTLQEDPQLSTESYGEGEMKRIHIILSNREEGRT